MLALHKFRHQCNRKSRRVGLPPPLSFAQHTSWISTAIFIRWRSSPHFLHFFELSFLIVYSTAVWSKLRHLKHLWEIFVPKSAHYFAISLTADSTGKLQRKIRVLRTPDTTYNPADVCQFRISFDFANDINRTNFLFLLMPLFAAYLCSLLGFTNCRFSPFVEVETIIEELPTFLRIFAGLIFFNEEFFFLAACWVPRVHSVVHPLGVLLSSARKIK